MSPRLHAPALLLGLALAASLLSATPLSAQSDPVVARVNGMEIRQSDLAMAEEDVGPQLQQLQQMPPEAKREYLITYLGDLLTVSKAAEDKKLGDSAEFKRKLALVRNKLLMETLLTAEAKTATTDAAMRKVYEEAVKQMSAEQEVHARHILVESEDEAKNILADLKKGGDFAAIAKEKSQDPGSAPNGGDLGFIGKGKTVKAFEDAAYALKVGTYTEKPVQSEYGWHVIKVTETRKEAAPTFEAEAERIRQDLIRDAYKAEMDKLKAAHKIEVLPPPPPPAAAPAAPAQPAQ
jgi:peptidyl-prolyl cis-trans isomerase C